MERIGDGPSGEALFRGQIDLAWGAPPGPNGGYLAALIIRSMRATIDDRSRQPRSITVHYLRPPAAGEVEIAVTVERSGRNASTCTARMTQGGKTTSLAVCVLAADFEAIDEWSTPPPDVPRPDDVEMLSFPSGAAPAIFTQVETRQAFGPAIFSGGDEATTGGWIRTAIPSPLDAELLALYADAWWPAPFSRLTPQMVVAPTLDLTIHFRGKPPVGDREQILGRFSSSTLVDGFWEEDGALWSEEGHLLAQSRQLALLRSVPTATP